MSSIEDNVYTPQVEVGHFGIGGDDYCSDNSDRCGGGTYYSLLLLFLTVHCQIDANNYHINHTFRCSDAKY